MATRFQADRDLVIVPESQGSKLDPSTRDGVGAKMGLDATKPLVGGRDDVQAHPRPGRGEVDVEALLAGSGRADWRNALKR